MRAHDVEAYEQEAGQPAKRLDSLGFGVRVEALPPLPGDDKASVIHSGQHVSVPS